MGNRVRFTFVGLGELRAALLKLPQELTDEARGIVQAHGTKAATAIAQAYGTHAKSGNLARHVKTRPSSSGDRFNVSLQVVSAAPHSLIYERGTKERKTKKGWGRGKMPKGRVFIPTMIRERYAMYGDLKRLLVRHGLLVVETLQ